MYHYMIKILLHIFIFAEVILILWFSTFETIEILKNVLKHYHLESIKISVTV